MDDFDYRLIENRSKAFEKWYSWSMKYNDYDPAFPLMRTYFQNNKVEIEERIWYHFLYGITYNEAAAFFLWKRFPFQEIQSLNDIKDWEEIHYKKIKYGTDARWNRKKFYKQVSSYFNWLQGKSQTERIKEFSSFDELYQDVKTLYNFGRMYAWNFLEGINENCEIKLTPSHMYLKESSSRMNRNGLCRALGKDDWVDREDFDDNEIEYMNKESENILKKLKDRYDDEDRYNYFNMETCLCSFGKLFKGKRYLGYYIQSEKELIDDYLKDSSDSYWIELKNCRKEFLKKSLWNFSISKDDDFLKSGSILEPWERNSLESFM